MKKQEKAFKELKKIFTKEPASISSTGLQQKNEDGSKYVGLCNRRSIIYRI